jgi:hypothetical protein
MHKNIDEVTEQLLGDLTLTNKNVAVLVEDKQDMAFWQRLITEFAPHLKPDFPMFLNPNFNASAKTGKGELKKYVPFVCEQLLICADSDNDAYHETTDTDWLAPRRPFIYQTYVHSRENHFFHYKNLENLCFEFAYQPYNFRPDFERISEALYDFLMLWLFFTDVKYSWLNKELSLNISWDSLVKIVEEIDFQAIETIETLRNIGVVIKENILDFGDEVEKTLRDNGCEYILEELHTFKSNCPIVPNQTLWYIQGHCAFDNIVLPYFEKVLALLEPQNQGKSYRDVLSSSYGSCFSEANPCLFFDLIKADFKADFPT